MTLPSDPGGVFESDAHRRVLGHLPLPTEDRVDVVPFIGRVGADAHTNLTATVLIGILADLEELDYASQDVAGWKLTEDGLSALTGPNGDEE